MAANISMKGGRYEAFTSLTPAWWDRSKEYMLDHYPNSEEIWGKGGVFDGVEYESRTLKDGIDGQEIPVYRHIRRADTGVTVGCGMTEDYQIVQPRKAFEFLDDLMKDGVMKYASAGILGKGEQLWILGLIPSDAGDEPIVGEHHRRYILWTDSFDGTSGLKWFPCITRVECENTLAIALSERKKNGDIYRSIRHKGDMDTKLEGARLAILEYNTAFQRYNAECRALISSRYTESDLKDYIEELVPSPADDATGRAKTIYGNKVEKITAGLEVPSSKIGDMAGTWWQVVNAVTFAVDHGGLFRTKGENKESNRFKQLMVGPGALLKRQAFEAALSRVAV